MSTQTPNMGLTKPVDGEAADIVTVNGNMDILDAAIGDVDVSTDGSLQDQIDGVRDSLSWKLIGSQSTVNTTISIDYTAYNEITVVVLLNNHDNAWLFTAPVMAILDAFGGYNRATFRHGSPNGNIRIDFNSSGVLCNECTWNGTDYFYAIRAYGR